MMTAPTDGIKQFDKRIETLYKSVSEVAKQRPNDLELQQLKDKLNQKWIFFDKLFAAVKSVEKGGMIVKAACQENPDMDEVPKYFNHLSKASAQFQLLDNQGDLQYCSTQLQMGRLVIRQAQVLEKEAALTECSHAGNINDDPRRKIQVAKLELLKARLEYQAALFDTHKENNKHVNTGFLQHAIEKLAAANELIGYVTVLIGVSKKTDESRQSVLQLTNSYKPSSLAKTGELKKLAQEFVILEREIRSEAAQDAALDENNAPRSGLSS